MEMSAKTLRVDNEEQEVPRFTDKAKLLVLLKAIGEEGRETFFRRDRYF